MISKTDITLILSDVHYKDWRFFVGPMGDGFYLQVQFEAPDNDAPAATEAPMQPQHGRKWYLSPHMTPSEVVQTAFSAVRWAEEHELRELFTYRGQRVFGPHFNLGELARFAATQEADHRLAPA